MREGERRSLSGKGERSKRGFGEAERRAPDGERREPMGGDRWLARSQPVPCFFFPTFRAPPPCSRVFDSRHPDPNHSPAMPIRNRGTPSPCGTCCGAAETRPARARPGEASALFCLIIVFFRVFFSGVSASPFSFPFFFRWFWPPQTLRLSGYSLPNPSRRDQRARNIFIKGAKRKENAREQAELRAETARKKGGKLATSIS